MNGIVLPVRLKAATNQGFSPGGGITVEYTHVSAKVQNLTFAKDVELHYRDRVSGVWRDEPMRWVANFGDYDLFGRSTDDSGPVTDEFALAYSVNGVTFWDNNNGLNYHLEPVPNVIGGNVVLSTATARVGQEPGGGFVFTTSWFEAEVYVNNLSFGKQVGVRASADGGATWSDTDGVFQGVGIEGNVVSSQGAEVWRCKTPELNINPASDHFRFAVYYHNLDTQQTFWDNNFGQDYKLSKTDSSIIR